ncbi:MAG TPA: NIPSNAP family protein [Sphingomonas sp.]|nr:NIPSNAP family protein [Sphingomonas sp.]
MITCIIRYELDPYKLTAFEEYARNWDKVIPRCGADLIGYFAPHEGTKTTAYGIYSIADLAAYETYRARLKADPLGQENYALSQREQFIRREERQFFKLASGGSATLSG